ncbi:21801_t:CDS:1, partial [Dentiscutata erythropus]
GRFSQEQIRSFKLFEKLILESGVTKFTTLVYSHFKDSEIQTSVKKINALLSESNIIREIIKSYNSIIHVDNSPIPVIVREDNQQEIEKKTKKISISENKRKKGREKVLKHLEEKRQECQQKYEEEAYKLKE